MIKVLSNGLRYFQRLQNLPDSTLVKSSHQDLILRPQFFNKTSWFHKLDHCIRKFSCIINNSATKPQSMMELDYKQAWLNTIQNDCKLRAYTVFKRDFFRIIFTPTDSRQWEKLTRLRIRSHKLSVETHRFNKTLLKTDYAPYLISSQLNMNSILWCLVLHMKTLEIIWRNICFTDIQNLSDN